MRVTMAIPTIDAIKILVDIQSNKLKDKTIR
jgi:hypothetical protein